MFGAMVNKSSLWIKGFKAKINILGSCKIFKPVYFILLEIPTYKPCFQKELTLCSST